MKQCIPDLTFEQAAWKAGYLYAAGVDEAGRGPWAGPLAAAAVILPADPSLLASLAGVRDSKQMTPAQRLSARASICESAVTWSVGYVSVEDIDGYGLASALNLAVRRAIEGLSHVPQYVFLDYMKLRGLSIPHTALKKGDARCLSIAAASVLAKTARDGLMCELDDRYPGYGFSRNKGYGTAEHLRSLERLGVCPAHRKSFSPVKSLLKQV